jgi:hypothetical protein
MSQEPPSSQLSFQTAAEDQDAPWDDDIHDYDDDLDLADELPGPESFENPPHMSEWPSITLQSYEQRSSLYPHAQARSMGLWEYPVGILLSVIIILTSP